VTQGLKGQQQQREYALDQARDKRAQAAEARAQGNYDEAEKNEREAAALMSRIFPAQKPAPSPFPSPAAAPQGLPTAAVPGAGNAPPSGVGPMPPLANLGTLPGAASAVAPAVAPAAAAPVAAGLTQEQMGLMAANPLLRKQAFALAEEQQKQALEERKMSPEYLRTRAQAVAEGEAMAPRVAAAGSAIVRPGAVGTEGPIWVNRPAGGTMDQQTLDMLAERVYKGDTKALTGLGRGAQGAENLMQVHQRVAQLAAERGTDASDILKNIAGQASAMSEARALGTRAAGFGVAEEAMKASLPLMLEASKNVPRTSFPAVNRLILEGRTQVGDPNVKQLLIAVDTAAKDYARTINPTGQTREGDINYARKLLSGADSPETLIAAAQQLSREAGVTRAAIEARKKALFGGDRGQPQQPAPAGGVSGSPAKAGPVNWQTYFGNK
jgi:hypothetical protein